MSWSSLGAYAYPDSAAAGSPFAFPFPIAYCILPHPKLLPLLLMLLLLLLVAVVSWRVPLLGFEVQASPPQSRCNAFV